MKLSLLVDFFYLGLSLSTSKYTFAFRDSGLLAVHLLILFAGAILAFMLEFTEFLLVSHTSGLTLSVAGIFKVNLYFVCLH